MIEADPTKDGGKDRRALQDDIHACTTERIIHNQQKLVALFNARPHLRLHHTDKEVVAISEEDIRFPLNYQPTKSPLEENL